MNERVLFQSTIFYLIYFDLFWIISVLVVYYTRHFDPPTPEAHPTTGFFQPDVP